MKAFEERLKGGHPNSLGNTIEVVEEVLSNNELFDELFQCYFSEDEIVRLRVSNAMKRICIADKSLLVPYLDDLLEKVSTIDQASTQWTLALLFKMMEKDMSSSQLEKAKTLLQHNLANQQDWIVLNNTMETLVHWSKEDEVLKNWLQEPLQKLQHDPRKSVAGRAKKLLKKL